MPAASFTVAAYLAESAELVDAVGEWYYSPTTLGRWLASINKAHAISGHPKPGVDPEVAMTMTGIRRERARPADKKLPLVLSDIRRVVGEIELNRWPTGVIGHRDYAMLIIGFSGAFRRSELASLDFSDVRLHPEDGLHILVRQSKTDQEGSGQMKGLPYGSNPATCPVCAYVRWRRVVDARSGPRSELMRIVRDSSLARHVCRDPGVAVLEKATGPLFRPVMKNGSIHDRAISGDVVNDVVKRRAAAAGYDDSVYGAHSLRRGFVTQAFRDGANHHEVMRQTWHKSVATVEGYSQETDPLAHNAVMRIGL